MVNANRSVTQIKTKSKPWTPLWILQKCLLCFKESRPPYLVEKFIHNIRLKETALVYFAKTLIFNLQKIKKTKREKLKCLYASPVGKEGKSFLAKIIQKFGYEDFGYLIFVYDGTEFDEEIYRGCSFIYEKGFRWYFSKKYVTPDYCKKYDYIFFWADDLDVDNFSYKNFIEIMERNNLENAQPALSNNSYYGLGITLKNEKYNIGRYTDFVENMATVFTRDAWTKYWNMMEKDYNFWGWGYPALAKSFCGYKNMGVVDCETIIHTRPVRTMNTIAPKERDIFLEKNKKYKRAMKISYGKLK